LPRTQAPASVPPVRMVSLLPPPCRPSTHRRAAAACMQAQARAPAARLQARHAALVLDVMLRGPLASPFQRSAVLQVRCFARVGVSLLVFNTRLRSRRSAFVGRGAAARVPAAASAAPTWSPAATARRASGSSSPTPTGSRTRASRQPRAASTAASTARHAPPAPAHLALVLADALSSSYPAGEELW